jgi:Zn-dependent peptidase ImmA (M78 family)/DNA-binding XRE family transcriptional regulator
VAPITRIGVAPPVLAWARSTARLPLDEAARRIGVTPGRLAEWESGKTAPTINQLRKMSDVYDRPLAALFMLEPPIAEPDRRPPDYRRPQTQAQVEPRSLQKAVLRAMRQQDALREIATELGTDVTQLVFPLAIDLKDDTEASGTRLREVLRLQSIPATTLSRPELFLRELITTAEDRHVTVIQVQNLDVKTMRGFSLGEGTCPIVGLNGADWPRGKIFTLLHELAHVAYRTSGVCDLEDTPSTDVEKNCNAVAAAALMPRNDFTQIARNRPKLINSSYARAVASTFGISGESAVLRMVNLGLATWDDYWRLKPEFDDAYRQFKAEEKERANPDSPLYYQLKARDLGRGFVRTVLRAYAEDVLSSRDLVALLEVKYDQVPKLASKVGEDMR